jgi:chromosomal replication initiation ATPase DnaA
MKQGRQLLLDMPLRQALGRDDFLVAPSNAAAVQMIDEWPAWPASAALLVGPEGSGKSHLAQVWQARSGATMMDAARLTIAGVPELLAGGAACLEMAELVDERALFHLLNLAKQNKASLLITSRLPVVEWKIKLPDLASRLNSMPMVQIAAPDDALLRGVLVKLFADRQINVDEALVSYMLTRMPRSLAAARRLVTEIDRQALEQKAEITRPFVGRVLAADESPDLFNGEGA